MDKVFRIYNLFAKRVYAGSLGKDLETNLRLLEKADGLEGKDGLISRIANVAVPAAILCLIVLVVYAGYMLISSQGNPDKLREGKEVLTNAIIGFFIIVLSTVILLLISNSLGLNVYK